MEIKRLKDSELLSKTQDLVKQERKVLTLILDHFEICSLKS